MKILMTHPTGNSNVRAVASAFNQAKMLVEFDTTIAINPKSKWLSVLPKTIQSQLLRREFPLNHKLIKSHPYIEFARMVLPKIGLKKFIVGEHSLAGIDAVYQNLDKKVSLRLERLVNDNKCTSVYAYEDGALQTFKKAKDLNLTCIYDLPIAYWHTGRNLMLEEASRLPAWSATLAGGIEDSTEKLERKSAEMSLADVIVVPGGFVANSLPEWTKTKQIIISPFGSPATKKKAVINFNEAEKSKLRILFVGSMSQRKGLADLFEAIKILNSPHLELIVMGSPMASMEFYYAQLPNFIYLNNRPHEQVLELMRTCDVFCLPSIVEGRALVMQEAMSQGLPLIITANTGGEDLIIEGKTGFLVPIRSPEVIADRLQWFLDNRNKVYEMGIMSQAHAANYTWDNYAQTIVSALQNKANN